MILYIYEYVSIVTNRKKQLVLMFIQTPEAGMIKEITKVNSTRVRIYKMNYNVIHQKFIYFFESYSYASQYY